MKIEMTHKEFLNFANGIAECKQAITSGAITSNRMFSFYIDSTMNKLRDDVITLNDHISQESTVDGADEYYKAHDLLLKGEWIPSNGVTYQTNGGIKDAFNEQYKDVYESIMTSRKALNKFMNQTIEVELTQISFTVIPDDMHDSTLFNKVFKETEDEILEIIANG